MAHVLLLFVGSFGMFSVFSFFFSQWTLWPLSVYFQHLTDVFLTFSSGTFFLSSLSGAKLSDSCFSQKHTMMTRESVPAEHVIQGRVWLAQHYSLKTSIRTRICTHLCAHTH